MISSVTCTKCSTVFTATEHQRLQIEQIYNCNGKMAVLKCPSCKRTFFLKLEEQKSGTDHIPDISFLCPAACCDGWASCVTPAGYAVPFYECGECGRTWSNMESLQRDISESIEQYPYRNSAYRYDSGIGWLPLEHRGITPDLYKKIKTENMPRKKLKVKKNQ